MYIYVYKYERSSTYVLAIDLGSGPSKGRAIMEHRGELEKLAEILMRNLSDDYNGQVPINWDAPLMLSQSMRSLTGKVPPEERPRFAKALPERISVNLE